MGQNVVARAGWDRTLAAALDATADLLVGRLPADATARVLPAALRVATEPGRYAAASALPRRLAARNPARAGTVDIVARAPQTGG